MTCANPPSSSGYVSRRVQSGTPTQNSEPSQQTSKNGKSNGCRGRNDGNKNSEKRKVPINQQPTARGKEVIRLPTWRVSGEVAHGASAGKGRQSVEEGGDGKVGNVMSDGKGPSPVDDGGDAAVKKAQCDGKEASPVDDGGDVAVKKAQSSGKEPAPKEKTVGPCGEPLTAGKCDEPVESIQREKTDTLKYPAEEKAERDPSPQQQEKTPAPTDLDIPAPTPSNTPSPSSSTSTSTSRSPSPTPPLPSSETLWKTTQPFIPSLPKPLRRGRLPLNKSLLAQLVENPSSCPLFRDPTASETETGLQGGSTQDEDGAVREANGYLLNPVDTIALGLPPTELSTRLFTPYCPPVVAQEDLWLPGLGLGMPGCPVVPDSTARYEADMRRVVGGGCGAGGVMGKVKLEGWGKVERREAGFEGEAVKALWSVPNWEGGEWSWEQIVWGFQTGWGWGWWWY
ncbi:hypothetical protein KC333_g2190 [Hortaea werneckii]|nr:hypothetical protein KC333_g2190 [Hortaea werneckii]KAI7301328.1 hypothetical protein KC326_g9178 [Hortaea werneckii]